MAAICFYAQFTKSKQGVNGLTVTWKVREINRTTRAVSLVATGQATNITFDDDGVYGYQYANADLVTNDYIAVAYTADTTVDQQQLPAMWTLWSLSWHDIATSMMTLAGSIGKLLVDRIDAAISSRSDGTGVTLATDAVSADALAASAVSDIQSGLATAANQTTILSRLGAFAGSGVNTVLGLLKALASKTATLPTDIGGTYDPSTDSLEAQKDSGAGDVLLNEVPGDYAQGSAGYALGRIGSGQATVVSPVSADGDVETYQGSKYANEDGNALDWTVGEASWPTDLTGYTIQARLSCGLRFTGSIVTATGTGRKVRVELSGADTDTIPVGKHRLWVVATQSDGDVMPPLIDAWWVSEASA